MRDTSSDARDTAGEVAHTVGDARDSVGEIAHTLGDTRDTAGETAHTSGDARDTAGEGAHTPRDTRDTAGDPARTISGSDFSLGGRPRHAGQEDTLPPMRLQRRQVTWSRYSTEALTFKCYCVRGNL
jgi:hypothetical protein